MKSQVLAVATQIVIMAIVISVALFFVGIGVLVLIHICVVGRAFRRGFTNNNTVETSTLGSTSMSRDDLEKLPCFDFKAREKGSSPVDCAVCLENFKAGDKCRLLPICRHSFHAECVDLWLLKTPICPVCRTSAGPIPDDDGESIIELRHIQQATSNVGREAATASESIENREVERVMTI